MRSRSRSDISLRRYCCGGSCCPSSTPSTVSSRPPMAVGNRCGPLLVVNSFGCWRSYRQLSPTRVLRGRPRLPALTRRLGVTVSLKVAGTLHRSGGREPSARGHVSEAPSRLLMHRASARSASMVSAPYEAGTPRRIAPSQRCPCMHSQNRSGQSLRRQGGGTHPPPAGWKGLP